MPGFTRAGLTRVSRASRTLLIQMIYSTAARPEPKLNPMKACLHQTIQRVHPPFALECWVHRCRAADDGSGTDAPASSLSARYDLCASLSVPRSHGPPSRWTPLPHQRPGWISFYRSSISSIVFVLMLYDELYSLRARVHESHVALKKFF